MPTAQFQRPADAWRVRVLKSALIINQAEPANRYAGDGASHEKFYADHRSLISACALDLNFVHAPLQRLVVRTITAMCPILKRKSKPLEHQQNNTSFSPL